MKRLLPNDRKPLMIAAAVAAAERYGYRNVTRDLIATEAGTSPALVSRYLGTMPMLRRTVMREAVKREIESIVAAGLAERDAQALKAPDALKRRAAKLLTL